MAGMCFTYGAMQGRRTQQLKRNAAKTGICVRLWHLVRECANCQRRTIASKRSIR